MNESLKVKKSTSLRNNEYYSMQDVFDNLYNKSNKGYNFTNLMQYITDENNIMLAYRSIKNNKGSTTAGTDKRDISYYEKMDRKELIKLIQRKFQNYTPKSVRRVEIPKPNGKTRPLGIPCVEDRIIQQCIRQVLEPICEAKFYAHSYGFRPNRSTEHALSRCSTLINKANLHYVVDIDIKGFFDNINHSKLKKQIWNMGIRDKNLISIIGKILKAEIEGEGIPTKGTPQGGIISPLLSNIALNELDWWVCSQWETFTTNHEYSFLGKYRAQKKTNLKEMWIVRYADDFKIFCRDYKSAEKIYHATTQWLSERLNLEVSSEKSKITNLRKKSSEFLGFKLKANLKGNKYICHTNMSDKALKNTTEMLKNQIKIINQKRDPNEVSKLNSMIMGSHNYYRLATHCCKDFSKIHFLATKTLDNRLKDVMSNKPKYSTTYQKLYGEYKGKTRTVLGVTVFPIYGCKFKIPKNFSQDICNYTETGRAKIHKKLTGYNNLIIYLLKNAQNNTSVQFNDNRISLIAGQQGKCYVTGEPLTPNNMECHHKLPRSQGGTDEYKNLVWVKSDIHKLIHCTQQDTIDKYMSILNLNEKGLARINSLRKQVGNLVI